MDLIKNENFETINEIIKFLKNKYNINPPLITLDMARGPIKAFLNKFSDIDIFICYYLFISRIVIHLPQLRSKSKQIYNKVLNILINIKLLYFIENEKIGIFCQKIEDEYNNTPLINFLNTLKIHI